MIDTDKYEGNTGPWETNSEDSQGVWQEHDENTPRHIAMVHPDQNWEDMSETEFMRMMADKQLIADAPLLFEEVKRLREAIVDMINSMDNHYIRDTQHAAGCLRDLIGYYDEEE